MPAGVGAQGDATLSARIAQLEALLADRDREVVQLRQYSQRLLDDFEATRADLGVAERDGATERRLRQEDARRLRRELIGSQTSLQKEISTREKELAKLRAQVASLRPRVVEQEELRDTFSEEMKKIRSASIDREADLVTRLAKEETGLAEARKDLESLRSKVVELEASLAAARTEAEKAGATAVDLDRELQASRAEGARWLAELETRKREEESLRRELAMKEEEIGKGAEAFAALRSSSDEKTEKLQSQVVTIESSFDAERLRREALENEVRELRAQNRELSKDVANARARADDPGRDEDGSDAAPRPIPVAALGAEGAPSDRLAEGFRGAVDAARRENDTLERGIRELRGETAQARALGGQIAEYDLRIR
ncbi:MAG: hypothetical protein ACREQY_14100, partial [Candidatus Binatia bacterium]